MKEIPFKGITRFSQESRRSKIAGNEESMNGKEQKFSTKLFYARDLSWKKIQSDKILSSQRRVLKKNFCEDGSIFSFIKKQWKADEMLCDI